MTKKRRVYQPRIVGGHVMMPAGLKRLHKYGDVSACLGGGLVLAARYTQSPRGHRDMDVNDPQTVNGNWYGCTTIDREAT